MSGQAIAPSRLFPEIDIYINIMKLKVEFEKEGITGGDRALERRIRIAQSRTIDQAAFDAREAVVERLQSQFEIRNKWVPR